MAHIITLPTFEDNRGTLSVCQNALPFDIKRFYFVYDVKQCRGGHRHKVSIQALVCLGGSCDIYIHNGTSEQTIKLHHPSQCLIIEPKDWHTMDNFSDHASLLVMSSTEYSRDDYIDDPYPAQ